MKLKWYGHSCFSMTFENGAVVVTDPFDDSVGYPLCTAKADIALTSHDHFDHNHVESLQGAPEKLLEPGVYERKGLKITGIASFHDDAEGAKRGLNTMFVVEAEGLRIAHLGDLGHPLSEAQAAQLQNIDVLLLPVGGFFTIDTPAAVEIVKALKPRCAIAMHFANGYCHFPVSDEKEFMKLTGAEMLANEIEVTKDAKLPAAAVMTYPA